MGKLFKLFPGLFRTYKQNSRTFKDFPGQKKNPGLSRTFPGCGNPVNHQLSALMVLNLLVACKFFGSLVVVFCKHLQRVKLAESNTVINAKPLYGSQPLLHFCKQKTPAVKF